MNYPKIIPIINEIDKKYLEKLGFKFQQIDNKNISIEIPEKYQYISKTVLFQLPVYYIVNEEKKVVIVIIESLKFWDKELLIRIEHNPYEIPNL
jgi:hypothetical protein